MSMTESLGQSTDRDTENKVGRQIMKFKTDRINGIEIDAVSNSVSPGIRSQEDDYTAFELATKLQEIKEIKEYGDQ